MAKKTEPVVTPEMEQGPEVTTAQQPNAEEAAEQANAAASSQELIDELTKLGKKFVEVVEVAWNSEPRKKAENELRGGLETVATTVEDGVKRVSSTKEAQGLVNVAEDVADKVRTSKIATELSNALAEGLRALSAQMDKVANELKKASAERDVPPSTSSDDGNDIPIARDNEG